RHWRWMGLRLQNRIAQSSLVHRALPGRGHRSRWNFARYFYYGSQTGRGYGFAEIWANYISQRDGRGRPFSTNEHGRDVRAYTSRDSQESLAAGRGGQRG